MKSSLRRLGWSSLACFAIAGCESSPPPPAPSAPTPAPTSPAEKDKNEIKSMPVDKADNGKLSDDEIAGIKKLPADEQPIAMAQLICPVSDGKLGGMGMPIKQEVDGKTFYLCCDNCVSEVKKDPAAVLAKLKK